VFAHRASTRRTLQPLAPLQPINTTEFTSVLGLETRDWADM
jgi:hypothetical protein